MRFKKNAPLQISFPLGGIGSGCIGLSGNGHLTDWEIFNRPGKGRFNGISHFAVRAGKQGKTADFRLLHGDESCNLQGVAQRFGYGAVEELLCGWPHFRNHQFEGSFPTAKISFDDPRFPGKVILHAWSPFIPGNALDSSFPAACFDIEIQNNTSSVLEYACIAVLTNPWTNPEHRNIHAGNRLTMQSGLPESDLEHGDLTIAADGNADCSGQAYFLRGNWRDGLEAYYMDAMRGGHFPERNYDEDRAGSDSGLLAVHFKLRPGQRRKAAFTLTWNIPFRCNDWHTNVEELVRKNNVVNRWRNYYAVQWKDSVRSAEAVMRKRETLETETRLFQKALTGGTLPKTARERIAANLAVLRSPTCLRLEDGTFYGWEGVAPSRGSCEGSCTHVWNYAQALAFLFPELERSMRESHLRYSIDKFGGAHFRLILPLGIHATPDMHRPCADGQFGDIMKFYRDWKLCGDPAWLRQWYPTLKKMIRYAWDPHNPDRWDPDRTGVLHGRQHHTLDTELFGPNSWLTGHYLGALAAIAEMAEAMQDAGFASECRKILKRGRRFTDQNLFNGEYYCQKIDLSDKGLLSMADEQGKQFFWNGDTGEIRYQIGDGCGIDSTLAQCYALLYGLPDVFDPEKNKQTLRSIYRYNFRKSFRDVFNPWRVFSLNDESGVQICTWPHGNAPVTPIPYHTETMHGFEWIFAAHLVTQGMFPEAETIIRSLYDRYDGTRRNPWNEVECGSNYARSLASYALIPAWSGFHFDMTCGMLGFDPPCGSERLSCFWSIGSAWGIYSQSGKNASLHVLHGELQLCSYRTRRKVEKFRFAGHERAFSGKQNVCRFKAPLLLSAGNILKITFQEKE